MKNYLYGFSVFAGCMFIFWYGGVNFFERGFLPAYFTLVSVVIGFMAAFFTKTTNT